MNNENQPDNQNQPEEEVAFDDSAQGGAEVNSALGAVAAERDQFKTALQHLQADFENYRKRVIKQQADGTARANEALVEKMLPVLDTIDMAVAHEPSQGLNQIASALVEVLQKEGLERIPAVDSPFDPNEHEAVVHEPGEGEGEPTVSEEMRAGYRWKGRVLRPAMVKVVG